jgi:hypothetical protein
MKRTKAAPILFLILSACVPRVGVDDNPCPCADGWRCCADDNVCVRTGDLCPDGSGPVGSDELVISGEVCTSTATELLFPVKVVLVIDSSSSMMFSDPSVKNTTTVIDGSTPSYNQGAKASCLAACEGAGTPKADCASLCDTKTAPARQAAAAALVNKFKNNPSVSFAIVRFNSRITVNAATTLPTHPGEFTNDLSRLQLAISSLNQADLLTDYQGALTTTRLVLEHDMKRQSPTDRSRTRYVVMFLSDGGVGPRCKAGCDNDKIEIGGGIIVDSWCDIPRDKWCENLNITDQTHCQDMTSWFPHLTSSCLEYNTDKMILDQVKSIAGLEDLYGVGGVSLNTAYLFDPTLPVAIQDLMGVKTSSDAACASDKDCDTVTTGERCTLVPSLKQTLCKAPAERLLIEMAAAGNGTYKSFSSGDKIDFLLFDYSSLFRPLGMTNLIATNVSARPGPAGRLVADSDGDGLSDEVESSAGLKLDAADSDDDGYGDLLERSLRDQGFDPGDAGRPQTPCPVADRVDFDGDGLNKCEEGALGTDPDKVDTDHDRIPDGVELAWGTNPLTIDDKIDLDFDGVFSGAEIKAHTDPRVADSSVHKDYGYTYTIKQLPGSLDRQCFGFTVRGVRLITTLRSTAKAGSQGFNRILVHFGEAPTDIPQDPGNFKVACVRAQYIADAPYKDPVLGKVKLERADFVSPYKLWQDLASAGTPACKTNPDCEDPCKGAPLP